MHRTVVNEVLSKDDRLTEGNFTPMGFVAAGIVG